jgi:ribonuclease HI
MQKFPKKSSPSQEIIAEFWKHKHTSDIDIYTDGSRTKTGVGAGIAICNNQRQRQAGVKQFTEAKKPLNIKANILSAELTAISIALDYFSKLCNKTCTIFTDSKGSLQSIRQYDPKNPIVQDIQAKLCRTYAFGNRISFCWIPSHCNIPGNECADKMAKAASSTPTSSFHLVTTQDLNFHIKVQGKKWLQNQWDAEDKNKLHLVDGKIGEKKYHIFKTRREEIKYNRIRLGHTRLTNRYLLVPNGEDGSDPPICIICNRQITIKHIFTHCPLYAETRKKKFGRKKCRKY